MFDLVRSYYHQVNETLKTDGLRGLLRKRIFWNRIATPVGMDLSTLPAYTDPLSGTSYRFVELSPEDMRIGKWSFTVPSRCYKASHYLRKGRRGFALVKDTTVFADLWCCSPSNNTEVIDHPDIKMLGIHCEKREAYAFDMFIDPDYRGENIALSFLRLLHFSLKTEGIQKVYGFYWNDNIPALWIHRMLKFKEYPKRRISRFFFLYKNGFVSGETPSSQGAQKG